MVKNFFCRLQEKIKYICSFRKYYRSTDENNNKYSERQRVIFMVDGKTIHGGLSDRLRGLFSVYHYCKMSDKEFRIYFVHPFKLEQYLMPNNIPWIIKKNELSYNTKNVDFRFFNSYCSINNMETAYFQLLASKKEEIHVYSNVTLHEERFKQYFDELFVPSEKVMQSVNECIVKNQINRDYISITFRFIGILGDFKDHSGYGEKASPERKIWYISKCRKAIEWLHKQFPDTYILVTADSNLFLDSVRDIEYVFFADGKLEHCDFANGEQDETKPFTDLILIKNALKSFGYYTGKMFMDSKFALTASLIGGHSFKMLNDNDIK